MGCGRVRAASPPTWHPGAPAVRRSFSWLQRGAGQERAWRLESKITAPADPTIGRPVEAPLDLVKGAVCHSSNVGAVLVDCLTIWISNIMYDCGDSDEPEFEDRARGALNPKVDALMGALATTNVPVVLVANEVGAGVAPPTRLGVVFADLQGEVNQKVAARANTVWQVVAGIPVRIK